MHCAHQTVVGCSVFFYQQLVPNGVLLHNNNTHLEGLKKLDESKSSCRSFHALHKQHSLPTGAGE